MMLITLFVPRVARVYKRVPQISSRSPTEAVYPGRIAASVNAYVPKMMNPMSAPFFTSPWIKNHASVITRYARNAYNGDCMLIPRVAYLGAMTVEMNGTSSNNNRAPKTKMGGTFIVLYTKILVCKPGRSRTPACQPPR